MQHHDLPRRKALKLLSASPRLACCLPPLQAAWRRRLRQRNGNLRLYAVIRAQATRARHPGIDQCRRIGRPARHARQRLAVRIWVQAGRTGNFPEARAARVAARHKKVYLVDLNEADTDGVLVTTELVDLLNLADPDNIGGSDTIDGVFTFPMECVETVHIVDASTLAVANDNNYPGGAPSRDPSKVDANEFIRIALPTPLSLD